MRFVWAIVAFVVATLLIGAGIAQRTVFLGPKTQQVAVSVTEDAAYTVIDSTVLRSLPGAQTLLARGDGEIHAALGRTADVTAWLSDTRYNTVSVDEEGQVSTTLVPPSAEVAEPSTRGVIGSDLWLDEYADEDTLIVDMQMPEGMSLIIAADGTAPAPADILLSWPRDTSTPWAGPLLVGGSVMLALGIVLYILAFRHQRRGRGPRRKGPGPLPPTEPLDMELVRAEERAALTGSRTDTPQTRAQLRRRNLMIPALGLSAVILTGCSADSWPQFSASPEPVVSETVLTPDNQQAPAVTETQAVRIVQRLAETVAAADASLDDELLATRMSGAPLAERQTAYTLRAGIDDHPMPAAIPTDDIIILLPQAFDGWPRTVLVMTEETPEAGTDPVAPVIFTMVQETPWSPYVLNYLSALQASATIPDLAPAWLGSQLIPPDSPFLALSPQNVALAFASVVDQGDASEYADLFDEASHSLAESLQASRQSVVAALAEHGASETSEVDFAMAQTDHAPVAMGTLGSGAIVAVSVLDTERVTPTSTDAVIKLGENPDANVLTGVTEASKGVETHYSMQLFFAVPSQGSVEPIRLLAVHQTLLSITVIK